MGEYAARAGTGHRGPRRGLRRSSGSAPRSAPWTTSPDDAKAVKSKAAIAALVTPAALKKRWALAEKMDAAELGKLVKAAGLPW